MAKSLTIELSDAQYEALCAASAAAHTSAEQFASQTVAMKLAENGSQTQTPKPREDPVVQIMRERGHLVDPREFGPPPQFPGMPPYGTPEWQAWLDEVDEDEPDLRDVNLADWVDR